MLRILVIGDPHFKVSGVVDHEKMILAVLEQCGKVAPDLIVVLGDILDRHEMMHVSPRTRAVNFLLELKKIATTYVLIGNHDLKNNRQFLSKEHGLVGLEHDSRLIVVDEPKELILDGKRFIFCPFVPNGRFKEALNLIPNWYGATAIFAHQEFRGANMDGAFSTEGDIWEPELPLVISGHIHLFQVIQKNLVYPGTPMQHHFGDNVDKGLSLFSFEKNQVNHERIYLALRRKVVFSLSSQEIERFVIPENCHAKLVITCPSGASKALRKHPLIRSWISEGHVVTYLEENEVGKGTLQLKRYQNFSNCVYDWIKDDQEMITIYQELLR